MVKKIYMRQKIKKKTIKNRWSNLKDEIEKMSENEKEIENPDEILKIVE